LDLYASLLAPLAWRVPGHPARMLHGFARAEQGSMLDLQAAANLTPSPARRGLYLRHALDERRHAGMFARRAAEIGRAEQRIGEGERAAPEADPVWASPVVADTEDLYERLGEVAFLAFVHLGEARGRRQFAAHVRTCRSIGDARTASLFEAIDTDEARHERYSVALLVELAGGERAARRALRRVRAWEAWRLFRRAGRAIAGRVYAAAMLVLFVAVAPFALLVRVVRPARAGWVGSGRR
jgi:rubrerythrin